MEQPELRVPSNSPQLQNPDFHRSNDRATRWYRIFGACVVMGIIGLVLSYRNSSAPLSAEERELLGKWVMPTGNQPLPANAVLHVYEFREGRQFIFHGIPVSAPAAASKMTGSWRVENGNLIVSAVGPNPEKIGETVLRIMSVSGANSPRIPKLQDQYRLIGREGQRLKLEQNSNKFDLEWFEQ